MLIEQCLCGRTEYSAIKMEGQRIALCRCGTQWQMTQTTRSNINDYYASGAYHQDEHRHPNLVPYQDRYAQDHAAAQLRIAAYRRVVYALHGKASCLDVGAANGAFVHAMQEAGHSCAGVEPDPRFKRPGVIYTGDIHAAPGKYDLITYHDVLEHVPDPRHELALAKQWLDTRYTSCIVVEVPDVHVDAGRKHFKPEHLWYFTLRTLVDVVRSVGLQAHAIDFPIPGKMVVYACLAPT